MTIEEIYVTIESLKKEGYSKEKLFCAVCLMFISDKLNYEDLEKSLKVLGYKLSDELKKYEIDKQKELISNYVKAFALEYDIEEFK